MLKIYYKTFNDDIVQSRNQNYKIKSNYQWIHTNFIYNMISYIIYVIARIFSFFYCKLYLKIDVENKEILKKYKNTGYFIYGNHTQPFGDVFFPTQVTSKRFYSICSEANLGIPIIGKILPMLGALVIPDSIKMTTKFIMGIQIRISQNKAVVIYPEAHVWPYYTKIRKFADTSFKFPIQMNCPSFCMTTTYYKRKWTRKPGIKIYVDGPFLPDEKLSKKERQSKLCEEIYNTMIQRSKNSNYEYIIYEKAKFEQ